MRTRSALLSPLVALTVAAALGATPALAGTPAAHSTAEPAHVTPYPAAVRSATHAHAAAAAGPQPCTGPGTISAAQSYYGFGYLANQIARAYQLSGFYQQGDEGQGQTIALLELEPNSATDIDAYQGCYQTHTTVNYIPVDGGVNGGGVDTTDPGSGEAALDIEQIVGLAPRATIDVYQAPDSVNGILDAYQAMVNNPAVTIISASWGACETGNPLPTLETPIFATAADHGISVLAAAGDDGSTDCGTSALAVDDPASQPQVTGVGGTTMPNLAAVGQQFAWNGSNMSLGVTGGGFSALWAEPSWQQAAAVPAEGSAAIAGELSCPAAASGGYCRGVPDISADADPYTGYIIYLTQNVTDPQTGTTSPELTATPWGGTSAAAPLWAALTALINASPACNAHNLGPLNPLLYQLAVTGMPGLTNITAGNNDDTAYSPSAYFTAQRGFSPVTGLGTPVGAPLAQSLCAETDTLTLNAPASVSSSCGQPVDVTAISASDAQGHALTYSVTGLPGGLAIDPTTGAISGTPTANANTTVRVTVTAANNGATQTRTIPWTVTGAPAPTTTTTPAQTAPITSSPPTTAPTESQPTDPGTPKSPSARVVHLTRRFGGHTIRLTLTITTHGDRRQLQVTYSTVAARTRTRVQSVTLVATRVTAYAAAHRPRKARLVVLQRTHKASGQFSVSLTPTRARQGVSIAVRYSTAPEHRIPLPGL